MKLFSNLQILKIKIKIQWFHIKLKIFLNLMRTKRVFWIIYFYIHSFFHSFKSHSVCLNHLMGTTTKSIRSFFRVSFINICVGQRHAYQEKKKKKKTDMHIWVYWCSIYVYGCLFKQILFLDLYLYHRFLYNLVILCLRITT